MEELELVVCFQVDVLYERVLVHMFHDLAEFNPDSFDVICGDSRYRCPVDFKTRKPPFVTYGLVDIPFLIQPEVALPFISKYRCFRLNIVSDDVKEHFLCPGFNDEKERFLRLKLARSFEKRVDFSFQSFVGNELVQILTVTVVMDGNDLHFVIVRVIFNWGFLVERGG